MDQDPEWEKEVAKVSNLLRARPNCRYALVIESPKGLEYLHSEAGILWLIGLFDACKDMAKSVLRGAPVGQVTRQELDEAIMNFENELKKNSGGEPN